MKKTHRLLQLLAVAGCVNFLVACGGGGSDGGGNPSASDSQRIPPLAGVAVNLSDRSVADQVVGNAANNLDVTQNLTGELGGYAGLLTGVQTAVQGTGKVSVANVSVALAKKVMQAPAARLATGAESMNENCDVSGTLQITTEQTAANAVSAGDRFVATANNCVMRVDGQVMTLRGQMRMDVLGGSSTNGDLANMSLAFQMTPLLVTVDSDEVGIDGGFELKFGSTEQNVTLTSLEALPYLSARVASNGQQLRSTLTAFTLVVNGRRLSGTATVSSAEGFASTAQYTWGTSRVLEFNASEQITSGQILITSGQSATILRLTFGQSCSYSLTCVAYESASNGGSFMPVRLYTWSEFTNL